MRATTIPGARDLEREELKRVLSSRLFSRAPTLSKILSYICEMHFGGQAQRIKEYNIAVEALGRDPDFDPAGDSIVRVEAARLRRHLEQYYGGEGADHPLQLRIAEVGYAPKFVASAAREMVPAAAPRAPAQPESGEQPSPDPAAEPQPLAALPRPGGRTRKAVIAAVTVVCFAAILASGYMRNRAARVSPPAPERVAPAAGASREIRIHAGSSAPRFIDSSGALWVNDDYFGGGSPFNRPDRQILRTLDQSLYQTGREGNFSYAIPLKPGLYELRLHFAETVYGQNQTDGAEKLRLFDVSVNGKPLLRSFDIAADAAGVNTADQKIFKDISPAADGFLHLDFATRRNEASLNGIEILPGTRGKALPLRLVCSTRAYYDRNGQFWQADRFFLGGRLVATSPPVEKADDPGVYASNRWGHFSYAIPVADGVYRLTMKFAETLTSSPNNGTPGRLFDIYCNGRMLVSRLDLYKEAGGRNRAMELSFHGLKPNAQNKLLLTFSPVVDYAIVFALEVEDEGVPMSAGALESQVPLFVP